MRLAVKLCLGLNKLFKLPIHPFNLSNEGKKSYAQWQYEKGMDTIKFYLKYTTTDEMFKDKDVLDIGCGAAGKTVFYASRGVKSIVGVEILGKYQEEAEALAVQYGMADKFTFVCADAAHTPFASNSFDTIIMNDAMEHVDEPEKVLDECYRILKKGGKLYLNFPPYNHPYGAHLSDAIGMPWVHVFFSDNTLIEAYKELVKDLPDGSERVEFRIAKRNDGSEYFSYINKMTIKRFTKIKENTKLKTAYYSEEPLRGIFKVTSRLPFFREFLVKMVVCVFTKE